MSYVKDNDGNIHRVVENTKVTREALVETFKKAEELLQRANQEIIEFDALNAPNETVDADPVPAAPEAPAPEVEVPAPVTETPAPTPEPVQEPTPAEQAAEIAEDAADLAADLKAEEVPAAPVAPTAEAPVAAPVSETPAPAVETPTESPVPQPQEIVVQ